MLQRSTWAGLGLAAMLALASGAAQALTVVSVSPRGEVAQVRQVVVSFDAPAVRFGDPKADDPYALSCSDAIAARGQARWLSDRRWVFDFAADLPPGVRCTLTPRPDFKPAEGASWKRATSYQFNTGGPFVQRVYPGSWGSIEEQQYFILQLNGDASAASIAEHVWCDLEGVGERVPVRAIDGAEREALLRARQLWEAAQKAPLRYPVLTCARRAAPDSHLELVYDQGVSTPSGIANRVARRYKFTVRAPFSAEFSCERENAQAACLPIRPMRLSFNAPVVRKLAMGIRLKGGGQTLTPQQDEGVQPADDDVVQAVSFAGPLSADTAYVLELPAGFQDASGRLLDNADSFPLKVATGAQPPLAKFAAAPFGIIERYAEGPDGPALLPVTLRRVEQQLKVQGLQPVADAGKVSTLRPQSDAEIIDWLRRVEQLEELWIKRSDAQPLVRDPLPPPMRAEPTQQEREAGYYTPDEATYVQSRRLSLLAGQPGVKKLDLPGPDKGDVRPFEVVGIPLDAGFNVVEIASPLLGQALLDERYGSTRAMYVRTTALVTNLAVHFKLGRENALAWVTTLDQGRPVADASVRVSDCKGKTLATARTGADGIARLEGLSPEAPSCDGPNYWRQAYFVSARAQDDLAFTWSDWQRGIEPWRFNLPISTSPAADSVAHTVFDRTLVRAGETVSMKHLLREQNGQGLALPRERPNQLIITHVGSGQQFRQPLHWQSTPTGGLSALSSFALAPAAHLGQYQVNLGWSQGGRQFEGGSFRVEEFRLPVFEGRIAPVASGPLVRVGALPTAVQVAYVSGGPAAQLPVRVSAVLRERSVDFEDYPGFSFSAPQERAGDGEDDGDAPEPAPRQRVVADKLALTLDDSGSGQVTLPELPPSRQPQELLLEADYADPNGEIQTLRSTQTLWPAAVVAGIKTEGWASSGERVRFRALALDLDGNVLKGVPLSVQALARSTTTSRKRLVGGFYSYDNRKQTQDLGTVCTGVSDKRGLVLCEAKLSQPGEVQLVATARDKDGNEAQAATSLWITRQGELWFGGEDHDRIDLLPEKREYAPGDTARLQVRMPFRHATALVSVEREGILATQVMELDGKDPTIELKIDERWSPNVYVSALVLRGRLREVPWYSFFTWGFKSPRQWWRAFREEGKQYIPPTAMVDLSRPAFRLGAAELRVGTAAHRIDVKLTTDQPSYQVRGKAKVTVQATLPDGKPAAHAQVALAAVDKALLELMPNTSWNLLQAMLQRRYWGVSTSTAQMEIIGRRHYGKKAAPAGGGGGHAQTRELLDTLLLWQPMIELDADGRAQVQVPLNDALTTFEIAAVADAGVALFGTGKTSVRVTQDLQIISGLPPLVREGDHFRAQFTLRNTTEQPMKVQVTPRATLLELPAQSVELAPGQARELGWDVTAPAQLGQTRLQELLWEISARDTLGQAHDALKLSQRLLPAVPLSVQQATLTQLSDSLTLPVAAPRDALPGRGGIKLALQPKLAEGLPGVRDWWANYPYSCLEQLASKAVGMDDGAAWRVLMAQLPTYLDEDGLAYYFAPRSGITHRGSDTLTAYLLAMSSEAARLNPAFALPAESLQAMQAGLTAFVEGRLERRFWSPRKDLELRKLAAIEALSRYGKADARWLRSITIAPNQWPTHAVIDWVNILQRVHGVPRQQEQLAQAMQVLRARLSWQGTRAGFSTDQSDYWWWLMQNGDVNLARLMLTVMDDPAWAQDMGRLANGFIARQQGGAWHTTTANLWGALALQAFSAKFESEPVTGVTRAALGEAQARVDWSRVVRAKASDEGGARHQTSWFGAPAAASNWLNNTMFLPWGKDATQGELRLNHLGGGKPWLTVQSLAAVALKAPFSAGYSVQRSVETVRRADGASAPDQYARGDVLRVTLKVRAQTDMSWVVITDPVPGGATILGSGLGRDSEIATGDEEGSGQAWLAFVERSFEAYRAYYEYLPKGEITLQYTLRLNNAGSFALPPTRVEALYAPEMFGEAPNAPLRVAPPAPAKP
ncbi:alpha-2-macroglobulin [Comamonas sp. NLF-1-9]|uniref:alpha-2-macroglobulin family protein n=1 Tax=Comamonas sp. NLF-1-9 TaxID=2853163 RepID=UPI001C454446|nr:MG2 domain-containing protein [Comamonas sp. NLF-1-9]QXL84490.1 alpha-2-macroglobulin [Comamonas sp. NLF-1-9]